MVAGAWERLMFDDIKGFESLVKLLFNITSDLVSDVLHLLVKRFLHFWVRDFFEFCE